MAITAPLGIASLVGFLYYPSVKLGALAVIFIWGAVIFTLGAISHRMAMRVDETGVTLVAQGRRAKPATFPWAEVHSVVLVKPRNVSMLGVNKLNAGIPVQPPAPNEDPKPDFSLPLTNWRVDMARLAEAIRAHAPEVIVADKR